jgi:hypothetical protein
MTNKNFIPYNNQKRSEHITELKHGFSVFDQVKAPQLAILGAKDMDNARFSMGISYIDRPFNMIDHEQNHEYEQYLFLVGGDFSKLNEFDAEIEFGLEGRINTINYPACIRVTPGLVYGPVNFTRVTKPIVWIHIVINATTPVPPKKTH